MIIYGIAFILPVWGVWRVVIGVKRRNFKTVFSGILIPVLYWVLMIALWEADRKFIESETEKNDGELPEWVW